jgi:YHS domain-containing protein
MNDQIDETAASISTLSIIENTSQLLLIPIGINYYFSKRSWKEKFEEKKT